MKNHLPALFVASLALPSNAAETLLFADNFEAPNINNLDNSALGTRRTGLLASSVFLRSAMFQHGISNNQLLFQGGGRTRFQNAGGWFNWGTDATVAPVIAAEGGVRISFDWTPVNTTDTNWVSFDVGFPGSGEPATRVNHGETDYGILFRHNGATERFDNGVNKGAGGTFTPAGPRHVVIDYAFPDLNDNTTVKVRASVNGTFVTRTVVGSLTLPYETFTWNNNGGGLFMELGTNVGGQLVDNYSVGTIPVEYSIAADVGGFPSGVALGDLVATLTGSSFAKGTEASTFTLVAGAGDTDNAKFQIDGNRIEANFDFKNDPNGTLYHIRVQGSSTVSTGTETKELTFTLFNDDDLDTLLDDWELEFAPNLTDLNGTATTPAEGAGNGDFDGDGISDLQEYTYSLGLYPDISPVSKDSDGDLLDDDDEIAGADFRPPTLPDRADSDLDGLNDFAENSHTVYTSPTSAGSNARNPDTDLDGARDGYEVAQGSDPNTGESRPALASAFAVTRVTDDASTGLDSAKYYTHAISGGGGATINDVVLEPLTPTVTPANFTWTVTPNLRGTIAPINNGDWSPGAGEVTGPGLLTMLGGFTYAGSNAPTIQQSYTLSGLVPGESYQLKLFMRMWDREGSGRPIDVKFINGENTNQPFSGLLCDRPGTVLQNGNEDSAYYLSYNYVAQGTQLTIEASAHESSAIDTGSFHFYGLTNEGLSGSPAALVVTSVMRNGGGDVILDFTGAANTEYQVTRSPDLVSPFVPLVPPLTATTGATGVGQATIPAAEASEKHEFYRIEDN